MDKMIVSVFNDETSAYEGVKALWNLHDEGSITVYAAAIIAKDSNGKISVKQTEDQGPAGTAVGLATGSFIGLLGGPVGVAIGATTGALAGSFYDLAQAGVGADFLDEVSARLAPGKTAVVAEIDEEWVTPVDARMDALGGVVFRRVRSDFIDDQLEREMEADDAELEELEAEYDRAVGEAKAKLQAKIDAARKRRQARRDRFKAKVEAIKAEAESKIRSLQEQAAKAKGEKKAKLEKRIAETRARHEARADKLRKAWQLIKEAAAV